MANFATSEVAIPKDFCPKPVSRRKKLRELRSSITKRSQELKEAKAENIILSGSFSSFPCSTPRPQAEKPSSSSMSHFSNTKVSSCPEDPTSSERLPGMLSWDSADNLHHLTSSSRPISSASALQLGSPIREKQMKKVATRQGPVKTSSETNHKRRLRKGKSLKSKNSITRRSKKPDKGEAENLDALPDDLSSSPCSNPQLQAEKSISSLMPLVLPSDCPDYPTVAPDSTMSLNTKRLPGTLSWNSADNIHRTVSSSKQVSCGSELQLKPTTREGQKAKPATKQEPAETCEGTRHTPNPRKGKSDDLRYSITKRSQKPDESKIEILDAQSDDFTRSTCSNPQLQAEKSINSSMPHFLNVLPSDCPDNPTEASNSTSSRQVSHVSPLQLGLTIREEQMENVTTKQDPAETSEGTYHTPNPPKGKLGGLKYSITKTNQKPDEGKAETQDALSDGFTDFPCSNPLLQAEKSISSSMPHFLNVLPSDCPENSIVAPNYTLSSSSKKLPVIMSSWNSAANIHQTASSSRQISCASDLQLNPTRREEQKAKVTTKQEPAETCEGIRHKPNSRKVKLGDLKYSIAKTNQKPDESKTEILDAQSDDFTRSTCSNPRLQAEKSISSSMPHFLNVLPTDCLDNLKETPNSTLTSCSKRLPGMSSWESADNINHLASLARPVSYASALQLGSTKREEHFKTAATPQQPEEPYKALLPTSDRNWKRIRGTNGNRKQLFQPRYLDEKGRLHHGSCVLGAEKSRECTKHTSQDCDIRVTTRCPFAHSWRGDTLQYVCTKCTSNNKDVCKEKVSHGMCIWNLGPYYKEDGTIWKESPQ